MMLARTRRGGCHHARRDRWPGRSAPAQQRQGISEAMSPPEPRQHDLTPATVPVRHQAPAHFRALQRHRVEKLAVDKLQHRAPPDAERRGTVLRRGTEMCYETEVGGDLV
jgi:hypothetical protein